MSPELHDAVLTWAAAAGRDLPWRRTRDPWAVLVSEVMLQQTQVARVVPSYLAFLDRFPTPAACAAVPVGDVVTAWAGLGYNRRAVALHAAATLLVRDGGQVPDTLAGLQRLPGVGPYTARAVLAFAFDQDTAVVDTNVARVLARMAGRPLSAREVQAAADAAVPQGEGWAWNQAMLDIGARLCRPRPPDCAACPLAAGCRWWGAGRPPPDPAVGSAGVSSGQSPFAGSDREGRGRLVAALRGGGRVATSAVPVVMGWPDDPGRADRVAATLAADGLVVVDADGYRLP